MTERGAQQSYSPDYWDNVSSQLRRRPSVMLSVGLLVLLYAVAIFAPLLANDRPLYFKGVDLSVYRRAQRELGLTTRALNELLTPASAAPDAAALESEVTAIEMRFDIMRRALAPDDETLLDEAAAGLKVIRKGLRGGDLAAAREAATDLVALAGRIGTELEPARPGAPPVPGRTVALAPYVEFPALGNLGRGEVLFMVLWTMLLLFPAWNRILDRSVYAGDLDRIRQGRKHKFFAFLVLPLISAAVWQGGQGAFFVSTYKTGIISGDVIAERIVFAPIPYGIAETNNSENFRPPTWHLESRIGEDGYYMFGPRSGRFDPATGIPKLAQPVDVRHGERQRNGPWRHALGTDSLGRDMLARIVWGARVSLAVGLISTILLVFIGTIVGSIAGFYGGWIDLVISRIIEIVQTFPFFFLILIVVAFIGPSILNIMLGIGLIRWTGVARLVRGEFIRLREQEFVVACQALGLSDARTIFRHVLPNALGPVLVSATFSVAAGILTESGLSFLGFGIQLPIPSWGSLLIESRSAEHWWIQIYPGLLIFLTVLLYNYLGEGVRDALDPRLRVIRGARAT